MKKMIVLMLLLSMSVIGCASEADNADKLPKKSLNNDNPPQRSFKDAFELYNPMQNQKSVPLDTTIEIAFWPDLVGYDTFNAFKDRVEGFLEIVGSDNNIYSYEVLDVKLGGDNPHTMIIKPDSLNSGIDYTIVIKDGENIAVTYQFSTVEEKMAVKGIRYEPSASRIDVWFTDSLEIEDAGDLCIESQNDGTFCIDNSQVSAGLNAQYYLTIPSEVSLGTGDLLKIPKSYMENNASEPIDMLPNINSTTDNTHYYIDINELDDCGDGIRCKGVFF